MKSIVVQTVGFSLLVMCLSGLKSLPSKEVRYDLTLCEASKVRTPTTVKTSGMVQAYELKGVSSYLTLVSEDGCTLRVNASQDIIGPALGHIGQENVYVTIQGEVKDGSISPKLNRDFILSEVVRKCNVPVYGWWEYTGINDGVVGYTRSSVNSYPTKIRIKNEIKETIPQDKQWYDGCIEETDGIKTVVSISR